MKILVVAPSWIGDTILAQPLFRLLHAQHPGLELDVLAPPWTLPLLKRMREVSSAVLNPFGHGELSLLARRALGRSLAARQYGQAVVLPNTFKSALAPFFARVPLRTGYRGEMRWGVLNDVRRLDEAALPQLAQRYAALAFPPGSPPPQNLAPPRLDIVDDARRATLEKFGIAADAVAVALCPGAEYGPAKRWPVEYYGELARALAARGTDVWLVGSHKDAAVGEEIVLAAGGAGTRCRNFCGSTSLGEAVDLLASARAVVSNDSGLMHVAAALGTPLVALYGSSSPAYTPPLSAAATILKLDLPCSPCFQRVCPLGHFKCMKDIGPDRVLGTLNLTLDRAPS